MRRQTALLGIAFAAGVAAIAGVAVASSVPTPAPAPTPAAVPAAATVPSAALSTTPPPADTIVMLGRSSTRSAPSEDTQSGNDQRLREGFSIETTPIDTSAAFSRSAALRRAKRMYPDYARQAKAITIRHVLYTKKDMAVQSDVALALMGVPERPKDLDAWMITFHKVTPRRDGPIGSKNTAADSNFVLVLSARTGEFIEACSFGAVKFD